MIGTGRRSVSGTLSVRGGCAVKGVTNACQTGGAADAKLSTAAVSPLDLSLTT